MRNYTELKKLYVKSLHAIPIMFWVSTRKLGHYASGFKERIFADAG